MLPWEFRNLTNVEQAELHAIFDVEKKIEQYVDSEQSKSMEKDREQPNTIRPGAS